MSGNGKHLDGEPSTAEHRIANFEAATHRAIAEWSDAELDAVIGKLRRDASGKPDRFALLLFLEDARLQRHEQRANHHSDGNGRRPEAPLA